VYAKVLKASVQGDQGLFELAIQLRTCFILLFTDMLVYLTDIGRNSDKMVGYDSNNYGRKKLNLKLMQNNYFQCQADNKLEVTPVVPFQKKIQYYQLKQSFLITPYKLFLAGFEKVYFEEK
jgi:hypothetical protein